MPDSTPEDSTPTPAPAAPPDEVVQAVQSAKPLAPRPRPAFTKKSKPKEVRKSPSIDLSDIPEAVPLDVIPEGIPVAAATATAKPAMASPKIRVPGNQPIRPKSTPQNRVAEVSTEPDVPERIPIDKSRIATFEAYEAGQNAVKPLEKLPGVESRQVQRIERPKFLDGELSRKIERGVQYPQPGRLLYTSFSLLAFKLALYLTAFGLTGLVIFSPENIGYGIWLPVALVVTGINFVLSANRTRCRICSCHMFYNRRCFKHAKSHRVFGLGHAGSAALHSILFKWLRCMYCGTAVRLRPPKENSEEAQAQRAVASGKASYDKSLIRPRK